MRRLTKFVVASVVVAAIGLFLLLNLGHQAELWLITEFETSTVALFGVGLFTGAALVFLAGLWRHLRKDAGRSLARNARNSALDEDL